MTTPEQPPIVDEDFEPIAPHLARERIMQTIVEKLGENWDDEDTGWMMVHNSDYLIRITQGATNIDFHCDLLGNVSVEEKPISPLQASGRLMAWAVLIASLFVAFTIASVSGTLN